MAALAGGTTREVMAAGRTSIAAMRYPCRGGRADALAERLSALAGHSAPILEYPAQ